MAGYSNLLALSVIVKASLCELVANKFCMVLKSLTLIFERFINFYGGTLLVWKFESNEFLIVKNYYYWFFLLVYDNGTWFGMFKPVENKFWRVLKSFKLTWFKFWGTLVVKEHYFGCPFIVLKDLWMTLKSYCFYSAVFFTFYPICKVEKISLTDWF